MATINLKAKQFIESNVEQLQYLIHNIKLDQKMNLAAQKIQFCFRAFRIRKAYQKVLASVIHIQRLFRSKLPESVEIIVEKEKQAPIIQKYIRGYFARESISIELHKFKMKRQLIEQEAFFMPQRNHILQGLQVILAYVFRKKKARVMRE